MSHSIDEDLPARTLQELLGQLRAGYVLRQPILVEIDDPWLNAPTGSESTLSVSTQRLTDSELPGELAGCRFVVVGRRRIADRAAGITVGRARTCDVVVDNYSVSKLHATIAHDVERDQYVIADENSRNGTRIDGNPIDPTARIALYAGAKVSFGAASYLFLDPPTLRKLARLAP
ncbi:MAG TPA: FHA domain-containing protein [Kofleriaceae bacterium]|nr:FHA domain-containing protein [Kofleriaceae bacterium]